MFAEITAINAAPMSARNALVSATTTLPYCTAEYATSIVQAAHTRVQMGSVRFAMSLVRAALAAHTQTAPLVQLPTNSVHHPIVNRCAVLTSTFLEAAKAATPTARPASPIRSATFAKLMPLSSIQCANIQAASALA